MTETKTETLRDLVDTDALEAIVADTAGIPEGSGVTVTWDPAGDAVRIRTVLAKNMSYDFRFFRVAGALAEGPEGGTGEEELMQMTVTGLWQADDRAQPPALAFRGDGGHPVQLATLLAPKGAPYSTAWLSQRVGGPLTGSSVGASVVLLTLTTVGAVVNMIRRPDPALEGKAPAPRDYGVGEYRRLITEFGGWGVDPAPQEAEPAEDAPANGAAATQAVAP